MGLALGTGLGLGIPLVAALGACLWFWSRYRGVVNAVQHSQLSRQRVAMWSKQNGNRGVMPHTESQVFGHDRGTVMSEDQTLSHTATYVPELGEHSVRGHPGIHILH